MLLLMKVGVIFLCITEVVWTGGLTKSDYNIQKNLKERLKDYNPMLRPNYTGAATEVNVILKNFFHTNSYSRQIVVNSNRF